MSLWLKKWKMLLLCTVQGHSRGQYKHYAVDTRTTHFEQHCCKHRYSEITNCLFCFPAPWHKFLAQKQTVAQLVNKYPSPFVYGIGICLTMFTRGSELPCSQQALSYRVHKRLWGTVFTRGSELTCSQVALSYHVHKRLWVTVFTRGSELACSQAALSYHVHKWLWVTMFTSGSELPCSQVALS